MANTFVDRAVIFVRAGKGGDGHVSFRRELYVPNGGPDGGDGGKGGDVIFTIDKGLNTLMDFKNIRKYKAGDGEEGGKRKQHGKNGKDIVIKVTPGTVIKDFRRRFISFQIQLSQGAEQSFLGRTQIQHGGHRHIAGDSGSTFKI